MEKRKPGEGAAALTVVAFVDPNDLLSFRLVPRTDRGRVIDFVVSNADTYLGYAELPTTAHCGYVRNGYVMHAIVFGYAGGTAKSGAVDDSEKCSLEARPPDHARRNPRGARTHRGHHPAHAADPPSARAGLSRHPAQARKSAADQRLQAARRGQCGRHAAESERARRVDDQRRQCGAGRRLCGAGAGVPCTSWRSKRRRNRSSTACGRWARNSSPSLRRAWKALDERAYPGAEGTFVHPFDDHNFIAGHGTMGLEILEDAPDTRPSSAASAAAGSSSASRARSRR
jgi:hypothetical protein